VPFGGAVLLSLSCALQGDAVRVRQGSKARTKTRCVNNRGFGIWLSQPSRTGAILLDTFTEHNFQNIPRTNDRPAIQKNARIRSVSSDAGASRPGRGEWEHVNRRRCCSAREFPR
jgi:hypothetical protein